MKQQHHHLCFVLILIGNYSVIIIANQRIPCDHQLHIHTCCLYAGGNTFCLRQGHVQVCLGVQRDNLTTALPMRTQNRSPKYQINSLRYTVAYALQTESRPIVRNTSHKRFNTAHTSSRSSLHTHSSSLCSTIGYFATLINLP